jgi:Tannase and feruloyl esterase/Tannase-like family of unknown function (DUF6351)
LKRLIKDEKRELMGRLWNCGNAPQKSLAGKVMLASWCFGLALLAMLHTTGVQANPDYSIHSPDVTIGGAVVGDSVRITVSAPSSALIERATIKLNGSDVTSAFHPDGTAGSLSGVVSGLVPGANTFEMFSRSGPKGAVARLVVARASGPVRTCESLASLSGFPIQPAGAIGGTTITSAVLVPATTGPNALPEYCRVQGTLQDRSGIAGVLGTVSFRSNQPYATRFDIRLPTLWNGRYMFQGGGGTEGGTPNATGSLTNGTNGVSMLRNGYVVAAQNGGHLNSQLPPTLPATLTTPSILSQNMFFPDALAVRDWGYNSIDVTTQTTKFLIDAYYGRHVDKSYFVGCSTSGRQGMAMSQLFPGHYDGVVAGDPFFIPPDISLSETWSLERIIDISPKDPVTQKPLFHLSIPPADQQLFTNAILAACDALDGLVDGVIEDMKICPFDPATFIFPSTEPYGSIAPGQPLQCIGAKTPTCLTPEQVNATKKIAEGPRTSSGQKIVSPDGTTLSGYPFDGGFMQPQGIPTRDIGTATVQPGNIGLGSGQLPLFWFTNPDPTYDPLAVNYDLDIPLVAATSPAINKSTDIKAFINRGGKLIFFHGLSDSGPPWPYTQQYFHDVMTQNGGLAGASKFMKMYLIPNMGHCGGNAATDRFDMLAPMVDWVENGVAPNEIVASGTNFFGTVGTLTGLPTTRSRPLCPYPKTLRYVSGDIALATSYQCQ